LSYLFPVFIVLFSILMCLFFVDIDMSLFIRYEHQTTRTVYKEMHIRERLFE